MRRKNYVMPEAEADMVSDLRMTESVLSVQIGTQNYDFERWCYVGGRPISAGEKSGPRADAGRIRLVLALRDAVSRLAKTLSPRSIYALCFGGLPHWFAFLDECTAQGQKISRVDDISRELLESYVAWLRQKPAQTESGILSYTAARSAYTHTKSILLECVAVGILSRDCLPVNAFPNSNRAAKGHQSFSKAEMVRLLAALAADLKAIRTGYFHRSESETLAIYFLLIAARTGRNPASLLELKRDALQPHPLKPDSHSQYCGAVFPTKPGNRGCRNHLG